MTITNSILEISQIIEGKLFAPPDFSDWRIEKIVTDSRTYFGGKNALFFALVGPRNNGHHFIPELIKKGVTAFIVSEKKFITGDAAFILVKNTTSALQKLAAFHRARFQYPVVGITGSNGKTIVKEWLHEILSGQLKIIRSPKSYNSQTGVPLSVLLMDNNYNLAIFEAGISQPGEMAKLQPIIKPEVGILTNIGDAHQENFKSKKQKLLEKLQLFKSAKQLVFNIDNELVGKEAQHFCSENSIKPVSWSLKNNNALLKFKHQAVGGKSNLSVVYNDEKFEFTVPFADESSIENACHCFVATLLLAKNARETLNVYTRLAPLAMRLEIKKGVNNCLLINDYYNSDLTSFSIALSVLHQQSKKGHLNKLVILSDIQQTGIPPKKLYRQINQLLAQWQINEIVGIGPEITAHSNEFTLPKSFYPATENFIKHRYKNQFSNAVILIKGARSFTFEKIAALLQQKAHQTVLEIDLNALVNNLNVFRSLLRPETKIMVMVKAFSYGTGDVEIAQLLQYQNVDSLAVAVADEGVELRNAGIQTPIIVMNPEQHSFQNIIDYRLEPNIYGEEVLLNFKKAVSENALNNYPVHLKIDTGMNRLGFKTRQEIKTIVSEISSGSQLRIKSVFSHLAASDNPDFDTFTQEQFNCFDILSEKITRAFPYKIDRHILNSAGIERFPEKQYEMVRLGIGLYGISATGLPLQNISTFKSSVSQVKKVSPGETIGYGRKGKIDRESEIAIVPVGYADGLDRKLSNGTGQARVNGQRVPITGTICMDMLMLDVTGKNVSAGDEVEFFGPHLSVSEVAEKAGTIPYEILTGISQRVKRVYLFE
ncbi:UDP-N-acetylmuramoyl-tripeptide--D-alanyl-D-alanine ligase [Tangfeifania diversioriginum]|uniref:Alanine racemase n=1 Tax=Tangfeifania diversioriginum TaxID=1168035 RepID=A0A1M6HTG1_9BACT|nr:bifunctional UDP-N-acetylmuramoyl-tripeptide:D-alanyl-D-alanine ligase/alanine racemase [Tangfeifania diversioriginum]SHJ25428.1 UDP-N-acetylmuramoyl-tripeptide--D-alanyl-D-alanine ligase [Tangfeifania diversioriginum]